jgi:hypothetical protein
LTYFFNVKKDALFLPTNTAVDIHDRYRKQLSLIERGLKHEIRRIVLQHNFNDAPQVWTLVWAFPKLEEIILLNHDKITSGQAVKLDNLEIDDNVVFGWQGNTSITE